MIAAQPRRPRSYILPVLLIVGGAVLLLANAGLLPADAGWRLLELWPLVLVMIGLQLIATRVFEGSTGAVVGLIAICLVAAIGLLYVFAGPIGGGSYTRYESSAAMAGVSSGVLTIDTAGSRVQVTGADLGSELYQARIDHAGPAPRVTAGGGDVHISSGPTGGATWNRKADVMEVTVNSAVPWTLVVNGAGVSVQVDLAAGQVRAFTLNGVGARADLALGEPDGTVPITVNGVGTEATATVPAGTEYRAAGEGLATVVSGSSETPGWATAGDRYDMAAKGVAAKLTVQERP